MRLRDEEELDGFSGGETPLWEEGERQSGISGYFTGFVGALLGAVVGAIPWFLASTFAGFYVGWLGFFVGVSACFGYRIFRGAKRMGYAMLVIILCSIFALILSEFAANMYTICTDRDWQKYARRMGVSVYQMAAEVLMMPDSLKLVLPNLVMGLIIGGLGVFSVRGQIRQYADPEGARKKAAAQEMAGLGQTASGLGDTAGLPLPHSFTLRMGDGFRKISKVLYGVAAVFAVLFAIVAVMTDGAGIGVFIFLTLLLLAEAVIFSAMGRKYRLEVDGEKLRFVSRSGKVREFTAGEIASVSISGNAQKILYDNEGRALAKLANNMENMALLNQYLMEHNVPLRG